MRHEMKLRPLPFGQIASAKKTIEARLYDEKRQSVQLGDIIRFINTDSDETFETKAVGLLRYTSFEEMFTYQDPRHFGFEAGDDARAAADVMRAYYSEEDEARYGVLGIELELLARR